MKKFWSSKTLWTNLIAAGAFFVSAQFGIEIPADVTVLALTVINTLLRLVTKEGLTA